jgi:purine-binding chemotaxis protein CheW
MKVAETEQLVVFTLDENRYALRLPQVERVVRVVEITPLPRAPEIVLGVIDVGGEVIPVVNIRQRFGLRPSPRKLSDQLVIARTSKRRLALVADMVTEMIAVGDDRWVSLAEVVPGLEHVEGIAKLEDGLILIHDLEKFLSFAEEQVLTRSLQQKDE